jgi:hypothetical protein
MKQIPTLSAIAFGFPVLLMFTSLALHPQGYYYLAAGPLCGVIGGAAVWRKWGPAIVLGLCFGAVGLMFALQDARSALFSDVIWTGLVSAFLFWVAGGCAALMLPPEKRVNIAAALAVPGAVAGMTFQFLYGPGHFLFDLSSRSWWRAFPWEHLFLWLIAGAGGGWAIGSSWTRQPVRRNRWAAASIICSALGLATAIFYFARSALPLGLFNSLSPAAAAADWLWGWGVLAAAIAAIAAFQPQRRLWAVAGIALAVTLVVASYRAEANPWKSQFDSQYAEKLLRENPGSGDAIYTGNLILARAALDNDDVATAKRYLLQAASTPGARRIEQSGLDVSVVRVLFERGEKDAVLDYLLRGRELWPQGAQIIARWEAAIRAGRRPNFSTRGPGGLGGGQGAAQDR